MIPQRSSPRRRKGCWLTSDRFKGKQKDERGEWENGVKEEIIGYPSEQREGLVVTKLREVWVVR
jgi:hypothetical protein